MSEGKRKIKTQSSTNIGKRLNKNHTAHSVNIVQFHTTLIVTHYYNTLQLIATGVCFKHGPTEPLPAGRFCIHLYTHLAKSILIFAYGDAVIQ